MLSNVVSLYENTVLAHIVISRLHTITIEIVEWFLNMGMIIMIAYHNCDVSRSNDHSSLAQ